MDPGSPPASWLEEAGVQFSSFIEGRKCSQNGRRLHLGVRVKSKPRTSTGAWQMCHTGAVAHRRHTSLLSITIPPSLSIHQVWGGEWPPPPDLEKRAGALPTFLHSISGQRLFSTHLPRMFSRTPECSDQLTHTVTRTGLSV